MILTATLRLIVLVLEPGPEPETGHQPCRAWCNGESVVM